MLIAVSGVAGSGKDTVCRRLAALLPDCEIERVAFADKVKDCVGALFDLTREEVEAWKVDPLWCVTLADDRQYTMRQMLQRMGTEVGRDVLGWDTWVKQVEYKFRFHYHDHKIVCVTDCRFGNEAEKVRQYGGEVWLIEGRGGIDGNHRSEQPIPDALITCRIDNSADGFEALDRQIMTALEPKLHVS